MKWSAHKLVLSGIKCSGPENSSPNRSPAGHRSLTGKPSTVFMSTSLHSPGYKHNVCKSQSLERSSDFESFSQNLPEPKRQPSAVVKLLLRALCSKRQRFKGRTTWAVNSPALFSVMCLPVSNILLVLNKSLLLLIIIASQQNSCIMLVAAPPVIVSLLPKFQSIL